MSDLAKRNRLIERILRQPEHREGRALVTTDEFFGGNDDLGSIGCNLTPHPGLDQFRLTIENLAKMPQVEEVWLQIYDFDEGDWPFSENLLIFGSIAKRDVIKHVDVLEPSEIWTLEMEWIPSRAPHLAGRKYVNAWWD